MKYILLFFSVLVFSTAFISCGSGSGTMHGQAINLDSPDSYYFEMATPENSKILDGIINFEKITDNEVSGTYSISNISDKNFTGLSGLNGNFSGQRSKKDNLIKLNMNPKVADNNIFVDLTIMKYYLLGSWVRSGLTGVISKGIFTSYKQ